MKNLNTTKREYKKIINKDIFNYVDKLNHQLNINKVLKSKLKQEIYTNIQKINQDKINNEIKKLRLNKLANKNNIN